MHGLALLAGTAATLGLVHTLAGPDHYLPFIVIARARRWSLSKTGWVTLLCGLGHVLSSVVLGLVGIALGVAVAKLKFVEAVRGGIAAWLLIGFGLVYLVWGIRRALRNRPHRHWHVHGAEPGHSHEHTHRDGHVHVHDRVDSPNLTPWVLFTIFVFGPCEPLIPLVIYPAARHNPAGVVLVAAVFGAVTIGTMLAVVVASTFGLSFLPLRRLERFSHAAAGAAILACGVAIKFLGL